MTKRVLQFFIRFFAILSIVFCYGWGAYTPLVFAADAPQPNCKACFCQTSGGAAQQGKLDSKTSAECLKTCGKNVAVCAYSLDQFPDRYLQCFTQQQCNTPYSGTDLSKKGKPIGLFSDVQPPECMEGSHYCFPNPALAPPLTLNVAIGSYKTAIDVAEYIQTIYDWMIGAGVTIAVVLMMIAGLQYVLGSAGGEAAKTAKKRIGDAVIGLILLLCVNLILKTVNPYLIRLQVPRLPMLKTITLLQSKPSCEKLKSEYILTDDKGKPFGDIGSKHCGESAIVKEKLDHTTVADGTTCDFKNCPGDPEAGCLGTGSQAKCLKCADLTYENKVQPPSSDVCNSLKLADDPSQNTLNYCFYSHDPSVTISGAAELGIAALITGTALVSGPSAVVVGGALTANYANNMRIGTCAVMPVECGQIQECGNYDNKVTVTSDIANSKLEGLFIPSVWGDMNLQKLCEANPCKVKAHDQNGKVVEGIAQTSVCKLDKTKIAGNDCVPNANLSISASAENKTESVGSCDPAKCKAQGPEFKCETGIVGSEKITACVSCGADLGGLKATDGLCADLSVGSLMCAKDKNTNVCVQVDCSKGAHDCSEYTAGICDKNQSLCNDNAPNGCVSSAGSCLKKS